MHISNHEVANNNKQWTVRAKNEKIIHKKARSVVNKPARCIYWRYNYMPMYVICSQSAGEEEKRKPSSRVYFCVSLSIDISNVMNKPVLCELRKYVLPLRGCQSNICTCSRRQRGRTCQTTECGASARISMGSGCVHTCT